MPDHTEADCRRLRALGALNRMSLPPATTKRKAHRAFRGGKAKNAKTAAKEAAASNSTALPGPAPRSPHGPQSPGSPHDTQSPRSPGSRRASPVPPTSPRASPPPNEAQASGVVGRAATPATTTIVDGEKKKNEKKKQE